jgi:hypothetical protein
MRSRGIKFWFLFGILSFVPAEITTTIFVAFILMAFFRGRISLRDYVFKAIAPFLGMMALGMLMAPGHDLAGIVKDFWYFSLPILPILVGWLLADGWDPEGIQYHLIGISTCISMYVMAQAGWLLLGGAISAENVFQWREAFLAGDFISIWGILAALNLLLNRKISRTARRMLLLFIAINGLAALAPASRTIVILLVASLLFVFIPARLTRMRRTYWIGISLAVGVVLVILSMGGGDPFSVLGRFQNILWEQFSFSFVDQSDANRKYRAFEALAAVNTYLSGSWLNWLFGHGFGHLVDLGMIMFLGLPGQEVGYQFVPILHNGYLFVLVKTGLAGLILYFVFLGRTLIEFFRCKLQTVQAAFWPRLGISIIIGATMATMVISGPFNKGSLFSSFVLLGMAMRFCFGKPARLLHPAPKP